jgi:hypothetical protein
VAHSRTANASLVNPGFGLSGEQSLNRWSSVRTASRVGNVSVNLIDQASGILKKPFDPSGYLLSHATIVASVDVFEPAGVKTGSILEDGFRVNRRYGNYRIRPTCDRYINNNLDAWERRVLLASYPTFIGAHNFVEHVQVEDLSKGRIIDAVARDIGDSVYVDILIATSREHAPLIASIENGKMATLSMGCFTAGTQVTTANGTRVSIEDVQPGDLVLTHKGRVREVVNKQIKGGKWDMRTVHAVGLASPITSTGNHPYYVLRPADVCACGCGESLPAYAPAVKKPTTRSLTRRFKRGHDKRIRNPNGSYSMDEFKRRKAQMDEIQNPELVKVRADELRVGDFIVFPRVKDGEHTVPVSEGKARLLGYFLAEGSFNKRKGRRTTLVFSFSMDEKDTFVAEVVRLLEQEFPGKNKPWVQDRVERNTCVVHLTSRKAADWFHKHGGEYSHGKRLSAEAMNFSQENHKHLIGAWLNGDGHRAKAHGGFLVGTTVSLDLASQMHTLMAKCGWFARFEARIGAKSVTVAEAINGGVAVRDEATGRLPAYLLTIGNTQSVELQGYCAKAPATSRYSNQNNRTFEDWVVSPITAIEESTYEGAVYNMEVDEDHTYIAEGASVGNCTVDGTICTKCGHWAADETEMCPHVKYHKGDIFFDTNGGRHRIAELCGHESISPHGGVHFIEASWVGTPAFTGAVLRNVIEPSVESTRRAQEILSTPPPQWDGSSRQKAAFGSTIAQWGDESDESGEGEGEAEKPPEDPLQTVEEDLTQHMLERVKKRIRQDMEKGDEEPTDLDETSYNETLVKEAAAAVRGSYEAGLRVLVASCHSDAHLIDRIAALNRRIGIDLPVEVYRTVLKVGGVDQYSGTSDFTRACYRTLGRRPTIAEAKAFVRLGTLISRRRAAATSSPSPREENHPGHRQGD